jgi:hypothetical protein
MSIAMYKGVVRPLPRGANRATATTKTGAPPALISQPGGRLRVTPDELQKASQGISETIVDIGIPLNDSAENQQVIVLDGSSPTVARMLVQALNASPPLATVSGQSAAGQTLLLQKYRPMITLYGSSVQLAAALDDSRAVMGKVQRQNWQQIKQAVIGARGKGIFPEDEQELMEAALNQLIGEETKIQQAPVDRRVRTRQANIKHQANLAAMGDHEALLNTMIDLQQGIPVDDEEKAQAAAAYQEQIQATAAPGAGHTKKVSPAP